MAGFLLSKIMRIRTIKPEFYTHEMLYEAEQEHSLPLRLAYTGLWCAADREGRFKWEPRRLGVQILPYDGINFSRVLDALHTHGFIGKYECEGNFFGFIPSFEKHQVINNRERDSELPNPYDCDEIDACITRASRDDHATLTCTSGREGKGTRKGKEQGKEILDDSLPFSSPDFLMFWSNWEQHRIEIKKKLTPTTKKQQLAKLGEMGEARAIAALKHSLAGGWQGIFEPQGAAATSTPTDDDILLMGAIDSIRTSWQKIPWSHEDRAALIKYKEQLAALTDDDLRVLKAYFESNAEGYFRPDNRSKFCESLSGIWTACERWKKATGYRAPNSRDSLYYGS
jgi:hypothetical protein